MAQAGLPGPVEIVGRKGDETIIKDLSENKWKYKIGLQGVESQFSNNQNKLDDQWQSQNLPINRSLTWYKVRTHIKIPIEIELN